MVVAVHTSALFGVPDFISPIFSQGARGVQLFFVISGYTLMLSVDRVHRSEIHKWASFALRRVFRIVPLYWLAAVAWYVFGAREPHYWSPNGADITDLLATMLFVSNWNFSMHSAIIPGGWSIAAEMNMYAMFPLFERITAKHRRGVVLVIASFAFAAVLSVAGYKYFSLHTEYPYLVRSFFNSYWLPVCIPSFLCGIMAYRILKTHTIAKQKVLIMVLLALVAGLAIAYSPLQLKALLFAPIFGCILIGVASQASPIKFPFFLTTLGKVSYSAYFVHFIILHVVQCHFGATLKLLQESCGGWLLAQAAVLVTTIAFSLVSYFVIEKPFTRIASRLIRAYQ